MNSLLKRLGQLTILPKVNVYLVHTNAQIVEAASTVQNRNPRNLELLKIARKPAGYHLERPGREYWHKLVVTTTSKHVTVEIMHFENEAVITASTKEWAIKKQLFKLNDRTAYRNLGRVLAQRCLESGITCISSDLEVEGEKLQLLVTELENGGVKLQEPERYIHAAPWDRYRYEKPWEIED